MDSKIRQLLESAHNYLANARRYLDSGEAVNWVCDEIHSGLMWAMEAWLIRYGHNPNFGNGWYSMRAQFFEVAPQKLRSNIFDCLAKVNSLSYQLEGGLDFKEPLLPIEKWKKDVYKCLAKAEEIIVTIEQDIAQVIVEQNCNL